MPRFSEPQIFAILCPAEGGVPVTELCREHGMSTASCYEWRAKYGGDIRLLAFFFSECHRLQSATKNIFTICSCREQCRNISRELSASWLAGRRR
ncbi:transposase-like protein [Roseovarius sp. MBR-51]